ncbi:MAG: cyclic nucleotide-binding domain-containing protein [Magnetococcales bacterium]|nr:cyclic nucleotide-binding domain-containing protein [Magnetococcales bacterium]
MQTDITLQELIHFLQKVPGFSEMPEMDLETLIAPITSIAIFEPGQYIIRRGTEGRTLYITYKGRVRINVPAPHDPDQHFFVDEGNLFGEMSLVSNQKRGADVIAASQVICLTIDVETFQSVMRHYWRVTKAIAGLIGQRIVTNEISKNRKS